MMHIRYSVYLLMLLFLVTACTKKDDDPIADRTVMVYMAANNNLAADAYANLNQMEQGFVGINGKLIVYARIFGQQPKIYEIVHDTSPEIKSKVLKTYNDHNSSDPEIMKMVFADMMQLSATRSYGAILWSHATNWAPADLGKISLRSFGDDNGRKMDVQQLKGALPRGLDFLIFDACSMASVEVLYQLRGVAPYILASPTEVLSVGLPYHKIIHLMYTQDVKLGLTELAKTYVAYYQQQSGLAQSATFSLIATRELDALAEQTKSLFSKYPMSAQQINRQHIQRLDLDPDSPVAAFDFLDMLEQNFNADQLSFLQGALAKAVVYKGHTSHFLGTPIHAFSGLSTYIPVPQEKSLFPFYHTLDWYDAAGYRLLSWE